MADLNLTGAFEYASPEDLDPNRIFPISNPQPAVGVPPQTTSPNQSGSGTSPGNGQSSDNRIFSGNVAPSIKVADQIKEKLLRPGLTSHYQCWFNPPPPVYEWIKKNKGFDYLGFGNGNKELISLSCSEAALPGSSFMTNEITDDYTGVTERHAYRRAYDDRTDFTFYVDHGRPDGNYNVLWFFEKWMQYIANEDDAFGLEDREFYYRVRFPKNYQTDGLFINKFERDLKGQFLQYKFMQAYPISINSIPVSYESSQLLKVTVSFTYTRYLTKRFSNIEQQEPGLVPAIGVPRPQTSIRPTPKPKEQLLLSRQPRIIRGVGNNPGQYNQGSGLITPPTNQ